MLRSGFPVRSGWLRGRSVLREGRRTGVSLEVDPGEPGPDDLPTLLLETDSRPDRHDADPTVLPLRRRVLEGVLVCAEAHRVPAVPAGDPQGLHLGVRGDRAQDPGPPRVVLVAGSAEALVRGLAAHPEDPADGVPARARGPRRGDRLAEQAPRLGPRTGGDVDELEKLVPVRIRLLGPGHPSQRGRQGLSEVDRFRRVRQPGYRVMAGIVAHVVNARLTRIRV